MYGNLLNHEAMYLEKETNRLNFGKSNIPKPMSKVNPKIETEFRFQTSRSSGKGGQHVNKVETRVEVFFDVENSEFLTDSQKSRIGNKLKNRVNSKGELHLANDDARTQLTNKKRVLKKIFSLIEKALYVKPERKKTKPSKRQKEKRLKEKKINSEKKTMRKSDFY